MGYFGAFFALLVALASIVWLLPTPPTSVTTSTLRGTPLDAPGPVIASIIRLLELDGLTIIPLVHLPPVKLTFQLPFTTRRLRIVIRTTASEVVFTRLRIDQVATRCIDAGRAPINVKADEVATIFSGSFGVTATVRFVPRGMDLNDERTNKPWKLSGSGRVEADIEHAAFALGLQLVKGKKDVPSVEVLSSQVDEGTINSLVVKGFGPWGGLATRVIPFVRGTVFVRWPTKLVSDFLIRDIVEGPATEGIAQGLSKWVEQHMDVKTYEAMIDSDRDKETSTPLDASSLAPPAASDSSSPAPPADPTEEGTDSPKIPNSEAGTDVSTEVEEAATMTTNFRMHSHLIGPTRLQHFMLPDYSPPLYRPGGTRAALQQWNKLTGEVQLQLSESGLTTLAFERAALAFDPPRSTSSSSGGKNRSNGSPDGIGGGDLVVTVHDLTVVLESRFKIFVETNQLLQWTTGLKKIGQKGRSTTTVKARTLQIRFELVTDRGRKGSPFRLQASSISPFTTIVPKTVLEDSKLQLGLEVMNFITESLKTQIAAAASLVVGQFMKDAVRGWLQQGMDGLEEKLREVGVELPHRLRGVEQEALD